MTGDLGLELEQRVQEIRGESRVLNQRLTDVREQLSQERDKVARLQGDLKVVKGEFDATEADSTVQNTVAGALSSARQELTEEMKRLLGEAFRRSPKDNVVGGIPVDSEYIKSLFLS